ncbi:transferase family-domain-containing protein [Aspergillus stella-maris]|uniref:transferase family-domain-containing protein n=1 Tax=Aspergillus stella-maris TaxID=1810926 RepID=UPI003CCDDBDE
MGDTARKQPTIDLISTTIVQPAQRPKRTIVPLSILDATVTHYASCAAVWFFDAPSSKSNGSNATGRLESDLDWTPTLQKSLSTTLSLFPHLAGELSILQCVPETDNDHTQRYGRLHVTFGTASDPGVEFITARCDLSLDEIAPSSEQRKLPESRAWNLSCSARVFLPDLSKIPFNTRPGQTPGPPVSIQFTQFNCGGIALGIRIAHTLADAQALAVFMHRWSYENSLLFSGEENNPKATKPFFTNGFFDSQPPVFNPQLLDTRAAGNIDVPQPDESILAKSRALPSSRHDWFWPADGDNPDAKLPPGLTRSMIKSPGQRMPKEDWDVTAPVGHIKLHFSAEQTLKIWEAAGDGVSRHDAIVAQVWSAINRARNLQDDEKDVNLYFTFGCRKRLNLSPSFMGSPILATTVKMPGKDASASSSPLSAIATKIHSDIALYTTDAVKSRLHDLCFESAPQRLWEAYIGHRHVIFTSWAHLHLYEVDFGGERGKARYVEPYMPELDGLLCLMEGRPHGAAKGRHWCDYGVDVQLSLEKGALERLKVDERLWM